MAFTVHQANMDEVWVLLLLSLAMLVGCYLAGSIPLAMPMSEEKLKLVSVLGAGLLVGTALTVIIPEGVHTLYETAEHAHKHSHSHEEKTSVVDKALTKVLHTEEDHHHQSHLEMHSLIGLALVLGFVFMLLVDQLSGGGHSHSHSAGPDPESQQSSSQTRHRITATLGLVVHAAADGVALGAAATTSQTHVEMIVFIAIMLHKAPAAFGLVSFLLHEGFDRSRIRKHLLVFSCAAPLMAIVTYFGLSQQDKETLSEINATGLAMLFSAGTFLYVSTVHILPEILKMGHSTAPGPTGTVIVREQHGFSKVELLAMVVGALLPLILSLGHHH